jgi:hypothetical protein
VATGGVAGASGTRKAVDIGASLRRMWSS